jgi:RNA polymerase sigma factor (sigma-70 family)
MSDVTRVLSQIESGDPTAAEQLLPLVYDELRRLARHKLSREQPGQTLSATALVHEAYLRLVGGRQERSEVGSQRSDEENQSDDLRPPTSEFRPLSPVSFDSRGHFFAAAAEAMRRILVEAARRRQAYKHGGAAKREEFDPDCIAAPVPDDELLALNDALDRLSGLDPQKAELVKLRYFAGLTSDQAAAALGISPSTADRWWVYARAWLGRTIAPS